MSSRLPFLVVAPLLLLLVPACSTCSTAPLAMHGEARRLVNTDGYGVALEGHDPVAFFTDNRPVKGQSSLAVRHDGATYHFASQEHLDAFRKDPARYVPAYGGYCGYAASIDRVSPVDVAYFQILDGRLVLQHNRKAFDLWNADLPGNIAKADAHWPGLVQEQGRGEQQLVNVDDDGLALQGHDPVGYVTDHRPIPGDPSITSNYNGAVYRFTSQEHRATFEQDPARYAPAFGGFCGYAASINKVSQVNVHIFQIVDGRLVLQHTPEAYSLFNADLNASVAEADSHWPGLVACHGR